LLSFSNKFEYNAIILDSPKKTTIVTSKTVYCNVFLPWNQIESHESGPCGHLSHMCMILMWCIRLVELTNRVDASYDGSISIEITLLTSPYKIQMNMVVTLKNDIIPIFE
jgi:hypothetical protein